MFCNRRLIIFVVFSINVCVLIFSGCGKPKMLPNQKPPVVVVAKPEKRDVQFYFKTNGYTEAFEYTKVPARVSGQLREIRYTPGYFVIAGDPLFLIEQDIYVANVNSAEALLASAKAQAELAKADLDRATELFQTRTVAKAEYDQSSAKFKVAEAKIEEAQAALERANLDLEYTEISAPISGKTEKNLIDVGSLVGTTPDNTILTTVAGMDPILVYFDVGSIQATQIHELLADEDPKVKEILEKLKTSKEKRDQEANKVSLTQNPTESENVTEDGVPTPQTQKKNTDNPMYGRIERNRTFSIGLNKGPGGKVDYKYTGIVDLSSNRVDPKTGTIQFRGQIPNEKYIVYPGQPVYVRVPTNLEKDAVVIRDEAIGIDLNNKYIFVVDANNIATRRNVEVSPVQEDGTRVVYKGLEHDENYVIKGVQKVREKQPVEIAKP